MCSVCVIKKFYAGVDPQKRTRCKISLIFYANLPLCVPSVRADFGSERTKDVAAKSEHTSPHNFELYMLDNDFDYSKDCHNCFELIHIHIIGH